MPGIGVLIRVDLFLFLSEFHWYGIIGCVSVSGTGGGAWIGALGDDGHFAWRWKGWVGACRWEHGSVHRGMDHGVCVCSFVVFLFFFVLLWGVSVYLLLHHVHISWVGSWGPAWGGSVQCGSSLGWMVFIRAVVYIYYICIVHDRVPFYTKRSGSLGIEDEGVGWVM